MKQLTKKLRFEVFKRDKFTCQYCGQVAPDVTLHVDHIHPKSKGGTNDLVNLVTSCRSCNLGKSNRLLSDDAAVKRQKKQLDELQERREQLEMMMEWQRSLLDLEEQTVTMLVNFCDDLTPGYGLTESGINSLKKWVKRFGFEEVVEAIKISHNQYLEYKPNNPDSLTEKSVSKAFCYIPRICVNRKKFKDEPYLRRLHYIRGILRNRLPYVNEHQSIELMRDAVQYGIPVQDIEDLSKVIKNWTEFRDTLEKWQLQRSTSLEH